MKAKAPYILLIIFAGIIAFLYFSKPSGHKQEVERLQGLIKKEQVNRDSLETHLQAVQDSLKIAFETIRQAREVTAEATKQKEIAQRKYEKVIHVRYATDEQRDSVLTSLYPSFGLR